MLFKSTRHIVKRVYVVIILNYYHNDNISYNYATVETFYNDISDNSERFVLRDLNFIDIKNYVKAERLSRFISNFSTKIIFLNGIYNVYLNTLTENNSRAANAFLETQNFKFHTKFEISCVVFPSSMIAFFIFPSLVLLFSTESLLNSTVTVRVIGHQWFWEYQIEQFVNNKFESILFNSFLIKDELKEGDKRLLVVSKPLDLHINTSTRFLITSVDVLHS